MKYPTSFKSLALVTLGLTLVWIESADGQSEGGKDRDPALLLKRTKRSRETPRSYESMMDFNFDMMRAGQSKKKEKPVESLDIPEAREGFSFESVTPPRMQSYVPPVRTDTEEGPKENWILPPKPEFDEEPEEYSDDPVDMMMRMYQEEAAARRSMIEGVLSGSEFTLGGAEERSRTEDDREPRYSEDDGGLREAGDNFLYSEENGLLEDTVDGSLNYSPVIMDTALQTEEDRTMGQSSMARLDPDQLENLSNEELAALADRSSQIEQNEVGLDDGERLSGIDRFTREDGFEPSSGLTRTMSILSTSSLTPLPGEDTASANSSDAATLTDRSWRGSLSTLSGVLNSTPNGSSASPGTVPPGGTQLGGGGVIHPSLSRIRDQFSSEKGTSSSIGFTPAASTGLGSVGNNLARPTSLGLSSSFSSGATPSSGSIGAGGASNFKPLSPTPRKRGLDVQSLDILMK